MIVTKSWPLCLSFGRFWWKTSAYEHRDRRSQGVTWDYSRRKEVLVSIYLLCDDTPRQCDTQCVSSPLCRLENCSRLWSVHNILMNNHVTLSLLHNALDLYGSINTYQIDLLLTDSLTWYQPSVRFTDELGFARRFCFDVCAKAWRRFDSIPCIQNREITYQSQNQDICRVKDRNNRMFDAAMTCYERSGSWEQWRNEVDYGVSCHHVISYTKSLSLYIVIAHTCSPTLHVYSWDWTQHTSSTSISPPALGPRSERSVRPNNSTNISKQTLVRPGS